MIILFIVNLIILVVMAEYRILLRGDKVKTIGYITKDKVVFEGKEYNERIGLEEK